MYGAKLSDAAAAYVLRVLADTSLQEWIAGARAELGQ